MKYTQKQNIWQKTKKSYNKLLKGTFTYLLYTVWKNFY